MQQDLKAVSYTHLFALTEEADAIERAVKAFLAKGYRTPDICAGKESVGTVEAGDLIVSFI